MTRDKLVTLLAWRLGNRKDMQERIISEMDMVQTITLEENAWLPWFLEKELADLQLLSGESSTQLPADFLSEIEDSPFYVVDALGNKSSTKKGVYRELLEKYPGSGRPVAYSLGVSNIQFFPVAEQNYAVQGRYYARDTLMSSANAQTLWLTYASDLVIALLGQEISSKHLQNPAQAEVFAADAKRAWTRLLYRHTAREELNVSHSLGEKY